MNKVAIIYTVRPVLATFPELLEEVVGEPLKIFNLLDDFLASDPGETGSFSIDNKNRLFNDLKSCELTGADVIVVGSFLFNKADRDKAIWELEHV